MGDAFRRQDCARHAASHARRRRSGPSSGHDICRVRCEVTPTRPVNELLARSYCAVQHGCRVTAHTYLEPWRLARMGLWSLPLYAHAAAPVLRRHDLSVRRSAQTERRGALLHLLSRRASFRCRCTALACTEAGEEESVQCALGAARLHPYDRILARRRIGYARHWQGLDTASSMRMCVCRKCLVDCISSFRAQPNPLCVIGGHSLVPGPLNPHIAPPLVHRPSPWGTYSITHSGAHAPLRPSHP